jgi:4-amino-4-deoxy-L-arabinose transferase-like glycosyltransferase
LNVNRKALLVGLLAVLAFAQTLAYYVYLRDDPGNYNGAGAGGDQVAYIELGQQILHGTWQGAVHYMPGLPAVLAVGQLITGDPRLGIALIQGVVYALMVVLVAQVSSRAFGERTAVWAAAAVALNPAIGYYAAQALTEFLTSAALLMLVWAIFIWSRAPRPSLLVVAGLLVGVLSYLRSEYLGLAVVFALIVVWVASRRARVSAALGQAAVLVAVTALAMTPWVVRYAIVTGQPALYNESPFSNLLLMGTWFRVFDEHTFSQLQQIETAQGTRDEAIARSASVGPRPDLSQRYMQQARGPYERPLPETLGLVAGNIQLNLRQYLVNHAILAPVLIWAGHTPVRQADATRLPSSMRYLIWGAELALLLLALWQAIRGLRDEATLAMSLSFLGVVLFLTAVHVIIAVDERFTTPALPLVGLFAGARLAQLAGARQRVASVRYAG